MPARHRDVSSSLPMGGIKRPVPKPHRTMPHPGWKRDATPARSKVPGIIAAVVGIVLVAVIGKLLLSFVTANGVYFERSRLRASTQAIANSLDVNQIKTLTGQPADENTPAFKALVARLVEIRKARSEVHFNYLMALKGSAVVFALDSTDPASDDYSPPGEVYEEATPALVSCFTTGESFVEGPVSDRWGTWVSGLAPIKDPSTGQVIAVMGMDVDATRWKVTLGASRLLAYVIIGLLLGVVVFFVRRVQSLQ